MTLIESGQNSLAQMFCGDRSADKSAGAPPSAESADGRTSLTRRADAPPSTSEDAGSEAEAVPPAIRALIFLLQIALSYWILFDI